MKAVIAVLISVLFLSACSSSSSFNRRHNPYPENRYTVDEKIALIPINVKVKESGFFSLEVLEDKSELATQLMRHEVLWKFSTFPNVELVTFEPENQAQQDRIDEVLGLFFRVALSAQHIDDLDGSWKRADYKLNDYTMGPNLYFVKEATGADSAVVVFAVDIVASTGKKMLAVASVFSGLPVNPAGVAFVQVGIAIHDIFEESPFN